MNEAALKPTALALPGEAGAAVRPTRNGPWRLRLAMYLAFALLALATGLQGMNTLRLEGLRSADNRIIDQTVAVRDLVLQTAQLAGELARSGAEVSLRGPLREALQELLSRSSEEALDLDQLLAQQAATQPGAHINGTLAAEAWRSARERLWYRCQALLRKAESAADADLVGAGAAVQAEVAPALQASKGLVHEMRQVAEQRALQLGRDVRWGMAGVLGLLGLLSLLVVEPTARSVRRHGRHLREQAKALEPLALVAERTSALVLITDEQDRIVWANAAFSQSTGWSLDEARSKRPDELLASPQADATVLAAMRLAMREGRGARHEWQHQARDGTELWLDVDLQPLHDEGGRASGFVRVCSDTTARVNQQAKLQALWAALPVGVTVLGHTGEIIEANLEAESMLGLSLAQMQGVEAGDPRWRAVRADGSPFPADELPAMRTLRTGLALKNQTLGVHTPDGRLRWLLVNTQPQRDNNGHLTGVVACFSDITEGRELQARLSDSARTDALTRLPNRTVVMERLQKAVEHARRNPGYSFAVMFMDFDRFKQVNDTLGHAAGDELLRQVAQRLTLATRPGDAVARVVSPMAARLGGDEFVVVLEGVGDAEAVGTIARRLLADLTEPYVLENTPVHGSMSIGVVLCADISSQVGAEASAEAVAEQVLRNADTAMYEAKRAGRSRWVLFDNSMHERVVRALEVEADLRRAIKAGELFVVYQPVVELADGSMSGAEALVRWRHPTRGLVPPVDFIPVAEECGLIDAVGTFVLETACKQFMHWRRTLGELGPRSMAVNLSRAQLKRPSVVDEVRAVLKGCGMQPGQLQLEVTETLAAQDERMQATLRELQGLGVKLALDDFGTGYSSLACLHQLPVDTVKIDRSFVKHAETVEYHRVLIEATIRVARTMGMQTVAEGIETEGQATLMRTLQCDRGQGYLFARPLEAADLEAWARARAPEALGAA